MSTQKLQYSTKSRLPCGCTPGAGVIFCVSKSLTADGSGTLEGTIVSEVLTSTGCEGQFYLYTFSFDDTQLTENAIVTSCSIRGAFCKGCLTDWVESLLVGVTCVDDTNTIDLTLGDCLSAEVKISTDAGNIITANSDGIFAPSSGGGGDGWLISGNAGTVDGTNFIGTTDNVPHDVRVNNTRVRRSVPDATSNAILDGNALNTLNGTISGCTILGGGAYQQSGIYNNINDGYYSTIAGGAGNTINPDGPPGVDNYGGYSTISGGADNRITYLGEATEDGAGFNTISGGQSNTIEGADVCVIGGGLINIIQYDANFLNPAPHIFNSQGKDVICGGNTNQIYGIHQITPPDYAGSNFIGSGETNEIDNGLYCAIVGGIDNIITTDSLQAVSSSTISHAINVIVGGNNNSITDSTLSFIGGGGREAGSVDPGNTITDSYGSVIVGGSVNSINSGSYSSILGGVRLTIGDASLGFSAVNHGASNQVDVSAFSKIAYLGDVDIWVANTDSTARAIKFFEPNADLDFSSTNYSSFKAQAQGANIDYVWPATAGTAGQQLTIDTVVGTVVTLKWA